MLSCRVEAAPAAAPPLLDMGQPTWVSIAQFYEEEDSGSSRSSSRCVSPVVLLQLRLVPSLLVQSIECVVVTNFHCPCRSSSRGSLRSERLSVTNGNSPLLNVIVPCLLPPHHHLRVGAANALGACALLNALANTQLHTHARSRCFRVWSIFLYRSKPLSPFFNLTHGQPLGLTAKQAVRAIAFQSDHRFVRVHVCVCVCVFVCVCVCVCVSRVKFQ